MTHFAAFLVYINSLSFRPERFLLADLVDWMHEVMHKSPEDWGYKRSDIRLDIKPLVLCAIMQNFPVGLRNLRAPTLDKLERVNRYFNVDLSQ